MKFHAIVLFTLGKNLKILFFIKKEHLLLNKINSCAINYNRIIQKQKRGKIMLSKPQYLYQVKLIIDCFPEEDYNSIPKETLNYIENNMQVDSSIVINPEISLEEQNIDPQTWQFLQKIAEDVDNNKFYNEFKKEINEYIENISEQNAGIEARIDNINLNKDVEKLHQQTQKLPKAKELIIDYQKVIANKEKEIKSLQDECNSLKEMINRLPKFIKMLFLRNKKVKLLEEKNGK